MLISEAFATFNAKQNNVQWSVSAISSSGEFVASLWDQFFEKRSKGSMTYVDRVTRWNGAGKDEFTRNLDHAYKNGLKVRAIIARSKQPDVIAAGGPGNNLGNTFHPKIEWVGEVTLWDGDNFEIEFRAEK